VSRTRLNYDPFGGILLSDEALLTDELEPDEKIVLGLMADPKNRDDSLSQLVHKGPYNRTRTTDARGRLRARGWVTMRAGGRYANSVRVTRIEPRFDGRAAKHSVLIHGELLRQVRAAAPKAGDTTILYVMLCIREQIRRGLVMLSDPDAARALHITDDQAFKARHRLIEAGIFVLDHVWNGREVYAIPNALVKPDPARFVAEAPYDLYAELGVAPLAADPPELAPAAEPSDEDDLNTFLDALDAAYDMGASRRSGTKAPSFGYQDPVVRVPRPRRSGTSPLQTYRPTSLHRPPEAVEEETPANERPVQTLAKDEAAPEKTVDDAELGERTSTHTPPALPVAPGSPAWRGTREQKAALHRWSAEQEDLPF
jgi:hypothetical protein